MPSVKLAERINRIPAKNKNKKHKIVITLRINNIEARRQWSKSLKFSGKMILNINFRASNLLHKN